MYNFAVDVSARVGLSWPWYVTRASGLVAAILLVLLMITGIAMFTGYGFKIMEPIKAWANHRTIGIAFCVAVAIHVLSLLLDKFVSFNIVQVLVPFASNYKPIKLLGISVGSLGVALGVAAIYLLIAIMITSIKSIMSGSPRFWKWVHLLSYALMAMIFFHAIMIGTDLHAGIWRLTWIGLAVIIVGFVGLRLRSTGSLD